jgi:hypothetical protein
MKYARAPTPGSTAVDACRLDGQPPPPRAGGSAAAAGSSPASSLPTRHAKGTAHDGHPVPTYSTVLLAVAPHVVTTSVPPSGVPTPRSRKKSARGPGNSADSPRAQLPEVYRPPTPAGPPRSTGAGNNPATPYSDVMGARDPHMGVWDTEAVGVAVADSELVGDAVTGGVRLRVGVAVDVREAVDVAVDERVAVGEGVGDGVAVAVRVPLADSDAVLDAVADCVAVADGVGVAVADGGNTADRDSTPGAPPTGSPNSVRPVGCWGASASAAAPASQLAAPLGMTDFSMPVRTCRLGTSALTLANSRHSCRVAGLRMPPHATL